MSEWIVVVGRFVPIGDRTPHTYRDNRARDGAPLLPNGEPLCQTVRLERIVTPFEPSVSAEQAEKEFLALAKDI